MPEWDSGDPPGDGFPSGSVRVLRQWEPWGDEVTPCAKKNVLQSKRCDNFSSLELT